ncbi:hypothetical protein AVEN_255878-1 [Araneus ventricosus]|uniref:Uncharacterized protein n=1 Tax=Araneus ventricosus TaxID=182803 RepID=A0A4Y2DFK7_ARAVE|nr:hypothetical protein AVEN_255878-1 [Araneus ventricosus]
MATILGFRRHWGSNFYYTPESLSNPSLMVKGIHPFHCGPWSFPQLCLEIPALSFRYLRMRGKGRPSPLQKILSSFPFTKPSAENTLLWRKNLLLNKLSRIKIAKLISFLTDNEDLIKQQPGSTSSSYSDPDFSS